MRVAAILPHYPPHKRVGAYMATHTYLAELAARGHDVHVHSYLSHEDGYELDGVTVAPGILGRDATVASSDIVISNLGSDPSAGRLAAQNNLPDVRMAHGKFVPRGALDDHGGPDLITFSSHALRDHVGWDGNAIITRPITRDAPCARGDLVTLVSCSQHKGVDTLNAVADAMRDRAFLAVEGGWGEQLPTAAPNIERIPTQNDMAVVWERTRVLLVPSDWESWCMTAVEACSHGIPVIAHPSPGIVEALGTAAFWVDRDDTQGWVETLRHLEDPAVYALASKRVRERFDQLDFSADIDRFVTTVEELAAKGRNR